MNIKKCPFCGGEALVRKELRDCYYLFCRCCAAQGPWTKNEKGAIRMWNMRTKHE